MPFIKHCDSADEAITMAGNVAVGNQGRRYSRKRNGSTPDIGSDPKSQRTSSVSHYTASRAKEQNHPTEKDRKAPKQSVGSRSEKPSKRLSQYIQACFPSGPVFFLEQTTLSKLVPDFWNIDPPTVDAVLVLSHISPPVALIISETSGESGGKTVLDFGHALARELTSILQGRMPDAICVFPVFVDRQQLQDAESARREVDEAVFKAKSLVPFGRWLMTRAKCEALRQAATEVLQLLSVK